jgi:hypothetical protein
VITTSALASLDGPEADVRRHWTLMSCPRIAAALPGSVQVKENGEAWPDDGANGTLPGWTVRMPAAQVSRRRNSTGCPLTTALTVIVAGKIDKVRVRNAPIDVNVEEAVETDVDVHLDDWQFTGEVPEPDDAQATAGAMTAARKTTVTTSSLRIVTSLVDARS